MSFWTIKKDPKQILLCTKQLHHNQLKIIDANFCNLNTVVITNILIFIAQQLL